MDSVEIIDKEYLEEVVALHQEKQIEELRSARNVIVHVGPRGGFRYLSYEYTSVDGISVHSSNGFKDKAEKLIEIFEQYGVNVEKRTEL